MTVSTLYGDAKHAQHDWLRQHLVDALAAQRLQYPLPTVVVGDLNWKGKTYDSHVTKPWTMADVVPTTRDSNTAAPTRCLTAGFSLGAVSAVPLAGVPHHLGVFYRIDVPAPPAEVKTTLTHTALYRWTHAPTPPEKDAIRQAAFTAAPAPPEGADVAAALSAWHARAEAARQATVTAGAAELERKAERAKGSFPSQRRVAATVPPGKANQCSSGVYGACGEDWTGQPGGVATSPRLCRRRPCGGDTVQWRTACSLQPVCRPLWPARILDAAIGDADKRQAAAATKERRARFNTWSVEALRAGAAALRPPSAPPTFSATDMRAEWAEH